MTNWEFDAPLECRHSECCYTNKRVIWFVSIFISLQFSFAADHHLLSLFICNSFEKAQVCLSLIEWKFLVIVTFQLLNGWHNYMNSVARAITFLVINKFRQFQNSMSKKLLVVNPFPVGRNTGCDTTLEVTIEFTTFNNHCDPKPS